MSHLSFARQMSSLKTQTKTFSDLIRDLRNAALLFIATIGDGCIPGDEECCVMVRGMAVILDILALLPHTEVVESGGSVEADSGPFLFRGK